MEEDDVNNWKEEVELKEVQNCEDQEGNNLMKNQTAQQDLQEQNFLISQVLTKAKIIPFCLVIILFLALLAILVKEYPDTDPQQTQLLNKSRQSTNVSLSSQMDFVEDANSKQYYQLLTVLKPHQKTIHHQPKVLTPLSTLSILLSTPIELQRDKQGKFILPIPEKNQNNDSSTTQISYACQDAYPIYHYFDSQMQKMYFRTKYGLYFSVCHAQTHKGTVNIGRTQFQRWNSERDLIEWALKYVRKGEIVYYHSPERFILQEIVILSKLVGKDGAVILHSTQFIECFQELIKLYNLNNIYEYYGQISEMKDYSLLITTDQLFFRMKKHEVNQGKGRMILGLLMQTYTQSNVFLNLIDNKKIKLARFAFTYNDCEVEIENLKPDGQPGYHLATAKEVNLVSRKQKYRLQILSQQKSKIINFLETDYKRYKKQLPKNRNQISIKDIINNAPIKLKDIKGITEEESIIWSQEIEVIEWIRNVSTNSSKVFYQRSQALNLWVILNVAALIPNGKLVVSCKKEQWLQIQHYTFILQIKNVQQGSDAATSDIIITDNIEVIKNIIQVGIQDRLLLGFFSQINRDSVEALYGFYVTHHIRKVKLVPSQLFGYVLFEHFFWSSEKPQGFFQIRAAKPILFHIWSKQINQLTPNRRFALKQSFRTHTAQVKVINPALLPFFILKDAPLHPSYSFLSGVHRSDYLRCYLMHHYGGGYSDIKHMHFDIGPLINRLEEGPKDIYVSGYQLRHPTHIACHESFLQESCSTLQEHYEKMIGVGAFIHRKGSPITSNWYKRLHSVLQWKYELLKENPAQVDRDSKSRNILVKGRIVQSKYPLRWGELNSQIFSRTLFDNLGHIDLTFPYVNTIDYRDQ